MKTVLFFGVVAPALLATSLAVMAQGAIYRCGNEYLNDAAVAAARGCQLVEGGHVTVVPGTRVNRVEEEAFKPAVASKPTRHDNRKAARPSQPSAGSDQRNRDIDAHSILLAELKTAETRLAEQQNEYNHGAPAKLAVEAQYPERYQDRLHELQEGIKRYTDDIAGLKREIARLPTTLSVPRSTAQAPW